jgi:23S rRNA pseudouridine1911/1915/1917 synthase
LPVTIRNLTADRAARLDVLVADGCGVTRSQAAKWIAAGFCELRGAAVQKAGTAVKPGDEILVRVPAPAPSTVEKEEIPIAILYQDQDLAVIDKPCGMVVHPTGAGGTGTLVNALLYALDGLSGIGGVLRPGIVHRLDKDTSGVLLVAKNDKAHLHLSRQLKDRTMEKHYLAVVEGEMKAEEGLIDRPVGRSVRDRKKMAVAAGGRPSQTEWKTLERLNRATLLDVHLLTGRTHQIRVHMQSVGHPVAGDPLYGLKGGVKAPRLMLHAHTLAFTHPRTGERLQFTAPPPAEFEEALRRLRLPERYAAERR